MTQNLKSEAFFERNRVFRLDEFSAFLGTEGSNEVAYARVNHFTASGRLKKLPGSVYAVIPHDSSPETHWIDPVVVASRSVKDAVISYHSALQLHGHAHTASSRVHVVTEKKIRPFRVIHNQVLFHSTPRFLLPDNQFLGTRELKLEQGTIRTTTIERTLIDCLRVPKYSYGIDEIVKVVPWLPELDFDFVLRYAEIIDQKTVYSALGWFFETFEPSLNPPGEFLQILKERKANSPFYHGTTPKEPGAFIGDWNIILPLSAVRSEYSQ